MFRKRGRLLCMILVALFAGTAVAYAASHHRGARFTQTGSATGDPVLLGDTAVQSSSDGGAGASEAFGYTASTSGTATNANVYLTSTGGVQVGLYADASGKPGALLDHGSVTTNAKGWVSLPLNAGVQITAGTRYWLAIAANGSKTVTYRDMGTGGSTLDYSGSGLANPYKVSAQWNSNPASVYVGGTTGTTTSSTTSSTSSQTTSTTTTSSTTTTPTTSTTTSTTSTTPPTSACLGAPGSKTTDYAALDACGYPSPNTAGVPAGTVLQTEATANLPAGASWSSGNLIIQGDNVTVSNVEVDGNVYVIGHNDTITRSLINDNGFDQAVHEDGATTGLTITYTTIHGGSSSSPGSQGILGSPGFTLDHDYIYHEVEDAEGSGITITNSYLISDGVVNGGHNEPIDIDDGSSPPNLIQHNTLLDPEGQTAAIIVGGPYGIIHDTTLDNNVVAGGGWTIYCCDASPWGPTGAPVNTAVTNNRFSRLYFANGGSAGPFGDLSNATTYTGNVWDDTNAPVQ